MLEKLKRPNQVMRVAERIGCYDMRSLERAGFDSFEAMEAAMAVTTRRG